MSSFALSATCYAARAQPSIIITNGVFPSGEQVIIASSGADKNEADKAMAFTINVKAVDGDVEVTGLSVGVAGTATGMLTTGYIFNGLTEVGNTPITKGVANFTNLRMRVAKDSTMLLAIKFDVRGATPTPAFFIPAINKVVAKSGRGGVTVVCESIFGEFFTVINSGPIFTLVGTPVLSKTVPLGSRSATTYAASFTFDVEAAGADLSIPANAFVIGIYSNGVLISTSTAVFEKPVSGAAGSKAPYTISENNCARFTAQASFTSNTAGIVAGQVFTARLESALGMTYVPDTFLATKDGPGSIVAF